MSCYDNSPTVHLAPYSPKELCHERIKLSYEMTTLVVRNCPRDLPPDVRKVLREVHALMGILKDLTVGFQRAIPLARDEEVGDA